MSETPEHTRRIVVTDYDPAWPTIAARLADDLHAACGAHLLRVEHIGSTSVRGLAAKPIIDLAPVAPTEDVRDACVGPIVALGLEHLGEYGIPGRRYFRGADGKSGLEVHLHLFTQDSTYLRRHLVFRDYLRSHPDEAAAYGAMKRNLATRLWRDGNEYADAKTPFISGCLDRAERWAVETGWGYETAAD